MSTQPNAPIHQCDVCTKSFVNGTAFDQHSTATGHGAHRYCQPCQRPFRSVVAFESHRATAKAHKKKYKPDKKPPKPSPNKNTAGKKQSSGGPAISSPQSKPEASSPASTHKDVQKPTQSSLQVGPPAPQVLSAVTKGPIVCKGITYSQIPKLFQNPILQALASRCHPLSHLKRHHYTIKNADGQKFKVVPSASTSVSVSGDSTNRFSNLPNASKGSRTRKAVVLDCEMVGMTDGTSEVVSVSALDFITGDVLVDTLVKPHDMSAVQAWRTQIHGIRPSVINSAQKKKGALLHNGWKAARAALFRHMDVDTILVGHALQSDLDVLRIWHDRIVDSQILASDAVVSGGEPQCEEETRFHQLGLHTLCKELAGFGIRQDAPEGHGNKTHDAREDTLATREVVLWCLQNKAALASWADKTREAYEEKQRRLFQARREKRAKLKKQAKREGQENHADEASEPEVLDHEIDDGTEETWQHDTKEASQTRYTSCAMS